MVWDGHHFGAQSVPLSNGLCAQLTLCGPCMSTMEQKELGMSDQQPEGPAYKNRDA